MGFRKYEGLGNDFIVVEVDGPDAIPVTYARRLCDRRRGIGADGVLLVLPPVDPAHAGRMMVINADGSVPEMCGNGLRCVALHVARKRGLREGKLVFETGAGALSCEISDPGGADDEGAITVDMGPVRWLEDIELDVDGDRWKLALADAGNPHAITTRPASRADIDRIGPRLATHTRFPKGTNVEFATVLSKTMIDLVVWERGVGVTEACGTGACATVAVAVEKGWCPRDTEIDVTLPGGVLQIRVDPRGHAIMRGPARHVFTGELSGGDAR